MEYEGNQVLVRVFTKRHPDCQYGGDEGKSLTFDLLVAERSSNAIDYNGISGKCPDWLEFVIVKLPKSTSC